MGKRRVSLPPSPEAAQCRRRTVGSWDRGPRNPILQHGGDLQDVPLGGFMKRQFSEDIIPPTCGGTTHELREEYDTWGPGHRPRGKNNPQCLPAGPELLVWHGEGRNADTPLRGSPKRIGTYHTAQEETDLGQIIGYKYAGATSPPGYSACQEVDTAQTQRAQEIQGTTHVLHEDANLLYHLNRARAEVSAPALRATPAPSLQQNRLW